MAVAENVGTKIDSSSENLDNSVVSSDSTEVVEKSKPKTDQNLNTNSVNTNVVGVINHQQQDSVPNGNHGFIAHQMSQMHGNGVQNQHLVDGYGGNGGESFKREMRDLEELLSKLNPMAEEFVPPSLVTNYHGYLAAGPNAGFGYPNNNFMLQNNFGNANANATANNGQINRRRKNGYNNAKRRVYHKMDMEKREEMIRRTVYVSDIDQQVTEEQLAALFLNCGQVVDCRVCGDPNSILRFAFVEFTDEVGARAALNLSGTMLGYYPLRVLPSKTAIAPVNPTFLPRSEDEREMCTRTIYCTNLDKKLTQADVKHFFESICGEVQRLRLLGDYHHSTRIAFVEFAVAESAIAALSCSGVVLGSLPIRVSPSKTPVRARAVRTPMH
ncbi:putative ataxin-2, nucleotide-binding alpha-beta plait domain-containing protein [Medicago truncatula]|uniref:CTC-interacting domain protein n=1 Tax=Medicago truncatula TaxID=3880 RepID=G7J8X9_MEDTR|nr:polyadenylate-binding protein-interacting protein 12 [Medicago truncatula]AES72612.1 CTC-interacting domain protein [Medicago truncatula]RHN69713.1 putative ataxin-2, nucleotide-binding alpha-beta plait domain-containing protein [Medicago truncatula]